MRRRCKVITAILLSAAMVIGSMSTGFAEEVAETAEVQETVPEQEDTEGSNIPGEDAAVEEEIVYENPEDAGEDLGIQAEPEEAVEAAQDDVEAVDESSDEVSVNVVEEEIDAEADAELDEVSPVTRLEYSYTHEYDGSLFDPGTFPVPAGYVLRDDNKVGSNQVGAEGKDCQLKKIKTVSESYAYYLYPTNATKDDDYTQTVNVSVTARPVTYRSATLTKEYDGKPLSQNSYENAELPKLVAGTLVNGESFGFVFDKTAVNYGDPSKDTSVPNKFTISTNGTADTKNYNPSYEYGNLIVTVSRGSVNQLPLPKKASATVDGKGAVTLKWTKSKSYKSTGKKGGKTTYKIFRYNDNGTWTCLNAEVKKTTFKDTNPSDGERLIYKIIPCGYDASGTFGEAETPLYVRATPKIISASPYDGVKSVNVSFMGLGTDTDEYTLEHWNNKSKGTKDELTVNRYNSSYAKYEGKVRSISTNTYTDKGGNSVTISVNKATFSFRIKAKESKVFDYGKQVSIPESAWSKIVKVKMISTSPVLRGERKSDSSFTLKWNKINKATAYLLEYSRDKNFSNANGTTTAVYCSKTEKTSTYNSREVTVENVGIGVPYYCRVTAYIKKKGDASYGTALGTSPVLVEYGRQKAVTDFQAEYFEDGNSKCDARLTWKDDVEAVKCYYVQRWSYAYNPATKQYDKETGYEVLQSYKSTSDNAVKKRYASTVGGKINNGELIKYRVQSVKYYGNNLGENYDGYVFSEPADYYYMNPTEVAFKKKKYTVKAGATFTPTWKFKPKKMPKTADGLTQSEFKEKFCLNDKLEFSLQSDALTTSEIKKIVTVGGSTGTLKGIKTHTKSDIKLKASSPNDPSEVYGLTIVNVGTGSSSESDDPEESSELVVCIDAGHGGKDDGATGNGITEKDMNLKIAKKVGSALSKKGVKVYYTRESDEYVSLTDRTDFAESKKCNLFVSIHCNSSEKSGTKGTEVYYSVKSKYAKEKLASKISSAVSNALGTDNIGSKTRQGNDGDYYSVIRTAAAKNIPGIIVEHAFVSNSDDAAALKDDSKLDAAAEAEAEAIYKHWKD